jgi:hypothetical protein
MGFQKNDDNEKEANVHDKKLETFQNVVVMRLTVIGTYFQ